MSFLLLLKLVLVLSIFLSLFSVALRARGVDWLYLVHNPGIGLRTLAAMYLVVPVVAVALAITFDLHPAVKVALVALSLSPVPPLLPRKLAKLGGDADYISGVLVGSALASLVIAPLGVTIIDAFVPGRIELTAAKIIPPLLVTVGLPLLAGRVFGSYLTAGTAEKVAGVTSRIALAMLVAGVLVILVFLARTLWSLAEAGTLLVIVAMIAAGLVAGYLLGGSARHRTVLALSASTRHPGAAAAIAASILPDEPLAPAAIVLFVIVNALVSVPLLRRIEAAGSGSSADDGRAAV